MERTEIEDRERSEKKRDSAVTWFATGGNPRDHLPLIEVGGGCSGRRDFNEGYGGCWGGHYQPPNRTKKRNEALKLESHDEEELGPHWQPPSPHSTSLITLSFEVTNGFSGGR
ncbi:hypothetical protein CRG98_000080 [Punica granatum]|uniref:Uncharacterized protein n=1 Tax=Punica granatum TaxID=22663 RepID=A0A2I0LG03_PUNGR|nr:hypothetical protein CRG98_000080 [Punica granatum]